MKQRLAVGMLVSALVCAGWQGTANDEKDAALLEKTCAGCHSLDTVTAERHTQLDWQGNVEEMVTRGATGSGEELAQVVAYLTRHFGKINVNTATAAQLQSFLGIGEKDAAAIVGYRDKNGKFQDLEQLKTVPGVNGDKLQEKRSLIAFSL